MKIKQCPLEKYVPTSNYETEYELYPDIPNNKYTFNLVKKKSYFYFLKP